jgi:diadenosine tetraphosphate (Ap4A) HIT family hydrolase
MSVAATRQPPDTTPQQAAGRRGRGSVSAMGGCLACESILSRSAPGGCIHETEHWFVDHCVGPLGVGTLIVKPKRHVLHVADLTHTEAAELGRLLQETSAVVAELERPEQVYVTLWSHADARPGHIHFVVQPVTQARMAEQGGRHGARLQVEMFDRKVYPDLTAAAAFADQACAVWPS